MALGVLVESAQDRFEKDSVYAEILDEITTLSGLQVRQGAKK